MEVEEINRLVVMAQKGNQQAFTDLVNGLRDDFYKIARVRLINEEDIDDAIQDAMLQIYKSMKQLNDYTKFKYWAIKIFVNKCNRIYRKKSKKEKYIEDHQIDKFVKENCFNEVEDDLNFYSLIKELTYEERIITTLYYKDEYKIKEIKKITGINENTIKTYLFRARVTLRQTIDEKAKKEGGYKYV